MPLRRAGIESGMFPVSERCDGAHTLAHTRSRNAAHVLSTSSQSYGFAVRPGQSDAGRRWRESGRASLRDISGADEGAASADVPNASRRLNSNRNCSPRALIAQRCSMSFSINESSQETDLIAILEELVASDDVQANCMFQLAIMMARISLEPAPESYKEESAQSLLALIRSKPKSNVVSLFGFGAPAERPLVRQTLSC